ncbi:DivIVA domain-containing protein [Streptomyces sp. NPDC059477]|uniref:DivIVA domain-containing protein n=1 Tax=Streptomyces sp. NPDC059477 TaxID=3346847 RepID=UPI0036A39CDF
MHGTWVSPQGFVTVRGRGYRPDQVDAFTEALSQDRDAAWERAARLTVLAKNMEAEAGRLRETAAGLPPQTYECLGERAQRVLRLAQEEADAVRDGVRRAGQERVAEAESYALGVRREAQEEADTLRAEVEERARQLLLAARAEADDLRVGARRDIKEGRGEALSALREVRQRTTGMLAEQHKEHAERWAAAEREVVGSAAALDAGHAERAARAEAALAAAQQAFAAAEESAGRLQEEARARAAELLADARLREDRIARETERVLCEHGERWDDVRAQMDNVRSSLAALTGGRAPAE